MIRNIVTKIELYDMEILCAIFRNYILHRNTLTQSRTLSFSHDLLEQNISTNVSTHAIQQ